MMASWQAAKGKAQFSGHLDEAETNGPQLIRRRKQTFIVTTETEMRRRFEEARDGKRRNFISAWEALRPPDNDECRERQHDNNALRWRQLELQSVSSFFEMEELGYDLDLLNE